MHSSIIGAALIASAAVVSARRGPILRHPHKTKTNAGAIRSDSLFGRASETCSNTQLSCHNTTAVADLCCFNYPGGALLQTQFWDTDPATGPTDSWTIHGLWPDNCDGTYDSYCDESRQYTNITEILQSFDKTDLLDYMNTYWVSDSGTDESFWEHEWGKHGTCISTLDTSCYTDYQTGEEVVDFFQKTVDLFKTLDSYTWLSNAGIVPSSSTTYTSSAIAAALKAGFGEDVEFDCDDDTLDEIYYYYNVQGSVQTGEFVPTGTIGDQTSCPSSGIKYLPKSSSTATATATGTATATTTTATATSTSGAFSGSGYLEAYTGGSQTGCLISKGTWYTTGTCATYTAAAVGSSTTEFTLTSSKGSCGVVDNTITCSSSTTATSFTNIDGYLASDGSNVFYAAAIPTGSVQESVTTTTNTVEVQFEWQAV